MNAIFDIVTYPWYPNLESLQDQSAENWDFVRVGRRLPDGSIQEAIQLAHEGHPARREAVDYIYTHNTRTGELYYNDSASSISIKCFLLTIANPIQVVGRVTYNVVKIPVDVVRVFIETISALLDSLRERENIFSSFFQKIGEGFADLTTSLIEDVWCAMRAPWYGLGFQISALQGLLLDPHKARVKIGQIERTWNYGASRFHTWQEQCMLCPPPERNSLTQCFQLARQVHTFYLAICMQKQGHMDDRIGEGELSPNRFVHVRHFSSWAEANRGMRNFSELERGENMTEYCCPLSNLCYSRG